MKSFGVRGTINDKLQIILLFQLSRFEYWIMVTLNTLILVGLALIVITRLVRTLLSVSLVVCDIRVHELKVTLFLVWHYSELGVESCTAIPTTFAPLKLPNVFMCTSRPNRLAYFTGLCTCWKSAGQTVISQVLCGKVARRSAGRGDALGQFWGGCSS